MKPVRFWWLNLRGGNQRALCVEAPTEAEAQLIAEANTGGKTEYIRPLPYPAEPRAKFSAFYDPKFPSFCYRPEQCAGRTCCPQNYSCTE